MKPQREREWRGMGEGREGGERGRGEKEMEKAINRVQLSRQFEL